MSARRNLGDRVPMLAQKAKIYYEKNTNLQPMVSSKNVILVDDDALILDLDLSYLAFSRPHLRVITCKSTKEAMAALEKKPFDLLITDLQRETPVCGRLLIADVRKLYPNTRIIVATGDRLTEAQVSCLGANAYLPKPYDCAMLLKNVDERYKDKQNAGDLLAIAPLVTRDAEIPYAHDQMEDYNPAFIQEFRVWLQGRYGNQIDKLNQAWGSQHKTFGEVAPPGSFGGNPGRDWYRFRDLKARQFVDSCAAALSDIPGLSVPYRLLLDYGNVGDPMAWKRGSLSFGFHAAQPMVWAVKHNDAHDYDQAYTGSLLGSCLSTIFGSD